MTFINKELLTILLTLFTFTLSTNTIVTQARRKMLGGWSPGNITDERVKDCTTFAFQQVLLDEANNDKYTFLENVNALNSIPIVVNVEQQVVAGMNYKIQFEIRKKDNEEECIGGIGVILYRRFNGEISITSWLDDFPCGSF